MPDAFDLPTEPGELDADERTSILVVDDLDEKLLALGVVLEELGQNLVFVRSGRDALREILMQDFAVILLDVNMPDLDGLDTAELIRSHRRSAHTPIIFITAYADEVQTARGYALGAVDYILSPVVPQVLRSKVSVFVALHKLRQQVRRHGEERAARLAAEAARRAAEENDRRSAFLSQASRALGRSLDRQLTMRQLGELVLQAGARQATVALADELDAGRPLYCRVALAPDGSAATSWLEAAELAADEAESLRRAMDERCSFARAPALAALPLLYGDRVHGALLAQAFAVEALPLLQELAARAAPAFDNAWLYRRLEKQIEVRIAAERELQAANRRKDDFLAMLSHELRNPMAAACSALDVLNLLATADERMTKVAAVMGRQMRQMTRLLDELLDVARISRNKIVLAREPVDLGVVVANSIESLQPTLRTRRQTVEVSLPPEPAWIDGDPARLMQIVANLVHNASKYSDPGKPIAVECSVDDDGACIRVRDQGQGIEAAMLPRIFDLFEQGAQGPDRAQGGLGVGLTLAQRLAQLHGGQIDAHSDGPGRGAEFRVRLPGVRAAKEEVVSAPAPAAPAPPPRLQVLIVDDNQDAADAVAELLRMAGHTVHVAADGPAGLAAAQRLQPDAMLIDIGLPLMDGHELARRLRQLPALARTRLVALTGYGQLEDRQEALRAGFDAHLVKPAPAELLLRQLQAGPEALGHAA